MSKDSVDVLFSVLRRNRGVRLVPADSYDVWFDKMKYTFGDDFFVIQKDGTGDTSCPYCGGDFVEFKIITSGAGIHHVCPLCNETGVVAK